MNDESANDASPLPLGPGSPLSNPELLSPADLGPDATVPRKRGRPVIAWTVVVLLTLLAALGQVLRKESAGGVAEEDEIGLVLMQMQARYVVGAARFPGLEQSETLLYEQAKTYNTGPVIQRLCFSTLAGELAGPDEALRQLAALDKKTAERGIKLTPKAAELERILRLLYRDYGRLRLDAPSVSPADRERLRKELGWFGELALVYNRIPPAWQVALSAPGLVLPANPVLGAVAAVAQGQADTRYKKEREWVLNPAKHTFLTLAGTALLAVLLGLAGLAGIIVLLILLYLGKLRGGLACGSLHGGVYAETFALWMVLFIGLSVAAAFLPSAIPRLPAQGAAMLLSLVVLAWPVVRGISWQQVREEIGWTTGSSALLEPLVGVGCYAMALPVLAVGVIVMLLLIALQHMLAGGGPSGDSFGPTGGPAHPIILAIANADWWTRLQVVLVAAVFAPIVEETMFRGVLYRHLREATCSAKPFWSVLLSATVVSLVFAVVHPQGLIAVPALMALAYAFCLAREWRGSLIAPMVAHGINNGLLMLFLMLALGD